MEVTIIEKKEKPLLSRKEVIAEAVYEKETPSREEIKKSLASSLSVKGDLIVVKNIVQEFGSRKAKILVYVYNSEQELKKIEPKQKPKKAKKAKAQEKKPEKEEAEDAGE